MASLGFYYNWIIIVIIFLVLTFIFDQLDGVVARLQGATEFGGFLDSTLDRFADIVIFVGVILGEHTNPFIGFIALIGSLLTSYTRAKIESLGIESMSGIGLIERTDRIPILLIGSILQIWIPVAIWWTIIILAIGANITVIQRIIFAYKALSNNFSQK
jgi:archaetidylinositol phosphate synthase